MTKKLLFSFSVLTVMFSVIGLLGAKVAHAQSVPSFPTGCGSAIGYSVTNGNPCNGRAVATNTLDGCTSSLGYSITTGIPCDGVSVAIQYLEGCSSVLGYSVTSSLPCNGTNIASTQYTNPTPGLPITGTGGVALQNILLLLASFTAIVLGSIYFIKKHRSIA